MTALALMLLRSGGRVRPLLVVACTASVTALLLVALTMLLLPVSPEEALFAVVADSGTRGGAAFGAAVMTVPLVLLLNQSLRLGQAAREQRLAGLRVAGATPGEVRRLGALEVAYPAAAGSVLGIGVFWALRSVLGGRSFDDPSAPVLGGYSLGLVPTSVTPAWWMVALLVLGITGAATVLGLRVGRRVVMTPQGLVREQAASRPRPWGLLVLGLAAVAAWTATWSSLSGTVLPAVGALTLTVLGLVMLAPWSAYVLGRAAEGRVTDVGALLACRRLVHEPGPAGRAGAAVGGIGVASAVVGALLGDLVGMSPVEFFYGFSLLLVGVCLLVALVVVSLSLAVQSAETLLDSRRSMASLHALGVAADTVRASQRWEGLLVAVPMSLLGGVIGAVGYLALVGPAPLAVVGAVVGVFATVVLSAVAVRLAVALTAPVTRRVVDAEHLRTA